MRSRLLIILLALFVSGGLFALFMGLTLAQAEKSIAYGDTVHGTITDRLGQSWTFYGCEDDIVTVTMQSHVFAGYLELYDSTSPDVSVDADAPEVGASAEIAAYPLSSSGVYTILATGSNIRDRGPYSLTLLLSDTMSLVDTDVSIILPGETVTGVVTSRLGSEWIFHGCGQDIITITLDSENFAPHLELYGPIGREPLTTSTDSELAAHIAAFVLPQTAGYTIVAAGQNIRARGDYTLTLDIAARQPVSPFAISTVTVTPTATPSPTATPTLTPSDTRLCTVQSAMLNLRSGPGLNFTILDGLPRNTQLRPIARTNTSSWIHVEVIGEGRVGWVSGSTQFVACTIAIQTLPIGIVPSLPTSTPTVTPTPTRTPTPDEQPSALQPRGVIVRAPGERGDLAGDVYTDPNFVVEWLDDTRTLVVRDQLYLELFAYDPAVGQGSGAGIDRVIFEIDCPNGSTYTHTERVARYCAFGGGEPNCSVLRLQPNARLPNSSCTIEDGLYFVDITAFPTNSRRASALWNFELSFQLPEDPADDDPGEGDPAEGDPGEGDPAEGDPGEGDPAEGDPGEGDPAGGDPGESDPAEGDPGEGDPAEGDPGEGDPAEDDPAEDDPAEDDPAEGDPAEGDPAEGDPAEDEPAEDDPVEDDPAEDESD